MPASAGAYQGGPQNLMYNDN